MALRCSKPVQPPRLCKVYRPAMAAEVHVAESALRIGAALRCSAPEHPSRLCKVYRPASAGAVHDAEKRCLRATATVQVCRGC